MNDALELSSRLPLMLIADDDPAIVKMLADRCAGVGFEVETATNGLQALIKANRSHPDVMIIDVNMPELCAPVSLATGAPDTPASSTARRKWVSGAPRCTASPVVTPIVRRWGRA